MNNHSAVVGEVEGYVASVEKIIGKVFFDNMLFVAAAYNKIIVAISRINLHDVPKNRHAAYLDHWLGNKMTFFAYPCSESTCKNDRFHEIAAFLLFCLYFSSIKYL